MSSSQNTSEALSVSPEALADVQARIVTLFKDKGIVTQSFAVDGRLTSDARRVIDMAREELGIPKDINTYGQVTPELIAKLSVYKPDTTSLKVSHSQSFDGLVTEPRRVEAHKPGGERAHRVGSVRGEREEIMLSVTAGGGANTVPARASDTKITGADSSGGLGGSLQPPKSDNGNNPILSSAVDEAREANKKLPKETHNRSADSDKTSARGGKEASTGPTEKGLGKEKTIAETLADAQRYVDGLKAIEKRQAEGLKVLEEQAKPSGILDKVSRGLSSWWTGLDTAVEEAAKTQRASNAAFSKARAEYEHKIEEAKKILAEGERYKQNGEPGLASERESQVRLMLRQDRSKDGVRKVALNGTSAGLAASENINAKAEQTRAAGETMDKVGRAAVAVGATGLTFGAGTVALAGGSAFATGLGAGAVTSTAVGIGTGILGGTAAGATVYGAASLGREVSKSVTNELIADDRISSIEKKKKGPDGKEITIHEWEIKEGGVVDSGMNVVRGVGDILVGVKNADYSSVVSDTWDGAKTSFTTAATSVTGTAIVGQASGLIRAIPKVGEALANAPTFISKPLEFLGVTGVAAVTGGAASASIGLARSYGLEREFEQAVKNVEERERRIIPEEEKQEKLHAYLELNGVSSEQLSQSFKSGFVTAAANSVLGRVANVETGKFASFNLPGAAKIISSTAQGGLAYNQLENDPRWQSGDRTQQFEALLSTAVAFAAGRTAKGAVQYVSEHGKDGATITAKKLYLDRWANPTRWSDPDSKFHSGNAEQ